jgi:hypothetical protein
MGTKEAEYHWSSVMFHCWWYVYPGGKRSVGSTLAQLKCLQFCCEFYVINIFVVRECNVKIFYEWKRVKSCRRMHRTGHAVVYLAVLDIWMCFIRCLKTAN